MNRTVLQRLARNAIHASSLPLWGDSRTDADDVPVDVRSLQRRLLSAQDRARPGFMRLRAVRKGADVLDFEWDYASAEAARMLCGDAIDLRGQRLVEFMHGLAGRGAVFNQYRRVVEFGAAKPVRQMCQVQHSLDVFRHAAVRLGDGVAVTLSNLNAVRREQALRAEIAARAGIDSSHAHA